MGPADDGGPTHVAALSRGAVLIECLANLGELPPLGSYFVFLPIKIARSSGGPGRAIALV
jgi:kynurenine formamidase